MSTDSYYTAMAGLQATKAQIEALSANLANVQTTGYQAVQAETQSADYSGENAPAGADVVTVPSGPDTKPGALSQTGNPMTIGVSGDAWLEVLTAAGPVLTRNGNLQITADGLLADSAGNPILGTDGTPISLPKLASLTIGSDGSLSGVPAGQPGQTKKFGQINLVATPAGPLTSLGGALFAPSDPAALQQSVSGTVSQGYLNGSNVDSVKSMVELIDLSRSYQLQTNLLKAGGDNGSGLNTILAQG